MHSNHECEYHYYPQSGWINDPNGLCRFQGNYHLFYQHTPHYEVPGHEPMVWGHAVTADFSEYTELPVALEADMPYDCKGVWSGTAIEKEGILYAYYAAVDANDKQTICVATSTDGVCFKKYAHNPIIENPPKDGSKDFRDPAILLTPDGLFLVVASADTEKNTGNLLLYRGRDMVTWEYVGVLLEYPECKFCECPSFVPAENGYLLSVSVVRNDGSHYFEVLYGSFDGHRFTPQLRSRFSKGPDEYAGQIFHDPITERNIMISWIPGWDYYHPEKCIGCLSTPVEISIKDGEILAFPIREKQHLLNDDNEIIDAYIRESFLDDGREIRVKICLD